MEFSIIVAAHDVKEDLFKRALLSACQQSFSDFECLVLCDDGSVNPEWLTDPRFKLVRVALSYFGAKHNEGIRQAQGDYLIFLDADDILSNEYLTESHRIISKYHPSLIFFDWSSDVASLAKGTTAEFQLYGQEQMKQFILKHYFTMNAFSTADHWSFGSMWAKVFSRKTLLEHHVFEPEHYIGSGDQIFVYEAAIHCDDGAVVASSFISYFWRINQQSVSNAKKRGNDLSWYPNFVTQLFDMYARNDLPQSVFSSAEEYICQFLIDDRLPTPLSVVPPLKIREIRHLLFGAVPPKSKVSECFKKAHPHTKNKGRKFLILCIKHKLYWLSAVGIAFYHRRKISSLYK